MVNTQYSPVRFFTKANKVTMKNYADIYLHTCFIISFRQCPRNGIMELLGITDSHIHSAHRESSVCDFYYLNVWSPSL